MMYTHSNQRVVGGSRAEELISRVAVRDVFERRMYSQLPANHVLDNIEVGVALTRVLFAVHSSPTPGFILVSKRITHL